MRWGFLWLFLPSLLRTVNTNQMFMPHEISRMRSLFAIIRHPHNYFSKAVFLVCSGVDGALRTCLQRAHSENTPAGSHFHTEHAD